MQRMLCWLKTNWKYIVQGNFDSRASITGKTVLTGCNLIGLTGAISLF